MRMAIAAAIFACSSIAAAEVTIDLGQFSLASHQTAHINAFNPGLGGWVEVRLVFSDAGGKTLIEHNETLQHGASATLSLAGNSILPGSQVRAAVVALRVQHPSSCTPDSTLQIVTKGLSISSISRGSVRQVPLNANEDAATHGLRTIAQAQGLYFDGKRQRGEPPMHAKSFDELEGAAILPKGHGADLETRSGYHYQFEVATLTYRVLATPRRSGDRQFYIDETGVIRFTVPEGPCTSPIGG